MRRDKGVDDNADLDSHYDTWMVSLGFVVMDTIDMECKLHPYYSEYDPSISTLVNAVTKYDQPYCKTYILMLKQSPRMLYEYIILLYLLQMSPNGLIVKGMVYIQGDDQSGKGGCFGVPYCDNYASENNLMRIYCVQHNHILSV